MTLPCFFVSLVTNNLYRSSFSLGGTCRMQIRFLLFLLVVFVSAIFSKMLQRVFPLLRSSLSFPLAFSLSAPRPALFS